MGEFSIAGISLNALTIVVALGGTWAVMQWRISRLEDDREKEQKEDEHLQDQINHQLEKMWLWKDNHEKETTTDKIDLSGKISELKAAAYHQYSENRDNMLKVKEETDKLRDWKHKHMAELNTKFSDIEQKLNDLKYIIQRLDSIEKKIDAQKRTH